MESLKQQRQMVMVSNRLPVDWVTEPDGSGAWQQAPGGLVTAVESIVRETGCLWVGWPGHGAEALGPFDLGNMRLVPVHLTADEVKGFYEGFSNGTLWPLYHDAISPPEYHREWWDEYRRVNERFAERIAETADQGALVWVHDYQLQLVPALLKQLRPDVSVGFFLHVPFPERRLFAQLPWRRQIIEGMLGADVIGFQRAQDAESFRIAAERYADSPSHGNMVVRGDHLPGAGTRALAQEFAISINPDAMAELAASPNAQARAREIRAELGDPATLMLGVDRLDYTKGISHRLKAYAELLAESGEDPGDLVFVQVASPSRERVEAYRELRDEIELTVGRINGDFGSIGHTPLVYLRQSYDRSEMAALYLAADVLVVTPLRDGMNLVAKEYVACRADETGVLVLSEFTGAADELTDALLVNPHDIQGLKAAFLRAMHMPQAMQQRRMRGLRQAVWQNDVSHWAQQFLHALETVSAETAELHEGKEAALAHVHIPSEVEVTLRRFATAPELIVATDFDGTVSPLVSRPEDARMHHRAAGALEVLRHSPGVHVVLMSGRSLASLAEVKALGEGFIVSGSHGGEMLGMEGIAPIVPLTTDEVRRRDRTQSAFKLMYGAVPGVAIEAKPYGCAVHVRRVKDAAYGDEILEAASQFAEQAGFLVRHGKRVREFSLRSVDKGTALRGIREVLGEAPVIFMGDDVTDEDVFRVLDADDLGIKVGAGETHAKHRVDDVEAAAAVLAMLAELRTGVVIGTTRSGERW